MQSLVADSVPVSRRDIMPQRIGVGVSSDLGIDKIDFTESRSGVKGYAEGRLTGLPAIDNTVFDFKIRDLSFTSEGLGSFVNGFAPSAKLSLGKYAPGDILDFSGNVNGTLNGSIVISYYAVCNIYRRILGTVKQQSAAVLVCAVISYYAVCKRSF